MIMSPKSGREPCIEKILYTVTPPPETNPTASGVTTSPMSAVMIFAAVDERLIVVSPESIECPWY